MKKTPDPLRELYDLFYAWVPLCSSAARPPLLPPDFPDSLTYCKELFRLEESFRTSTDEAARYLIANGVPTEKADPWSRYFLALRVESAIAFLGECSCEDPLGFRLASVRQDRACVCEALLCALWKTYRRDHWLKAVTFSAYFDLPLFGIVPASD